MSCGEAFEVAERLFGKGDYQQAFEAYLSLLKTTLADKAPFEPCHLIVLERLGDLAALYQIPTAADALFAGLAALAYNHNNPYMADYATIKRATLWVGTGDLRQAFTHLQSLKSRIGNVYAIDFADLGAWEQRIAWKDDTPQDRAVIFTQLYALMGRILAGLGQYRDAVRVFDRGLSYSAQPRMPSLVRHADLPLRLYRVQALLEQGELQLVSDTLPSLQDSINVQRSPGFLVQWHDMNARLAMLQGDFGVMLEHLRTIVVLCEKRRFLNAQLNALLNLANALILLNQIVAATHCLQWAHQQAQRLGNQSILLRTLYLSQIANARIQSMGIGVDFAPTVSEMQSSRPADKEAQAESARLPDPLQIPQTSSYLRFYEDRVLAFYWHLSRSDLKAAETILTQLEKTFKATDSQVIHLRLRALQGTLAYYQGEIERAESLLQAVRTEMEAKHLLPELWQIQRVLIWCWTRAQKPDVQIQTLIDANETLLATITQTLSPEAQSVFLLNKWSADEEYLASRIKQLIQKKWALQEAPWYKRAARHWDLMREIYALLQYIDQHRQSRAQQAVGRETEAQPDPVSTPLWRYLLQRSRKRADVIYVTLPDRVFIVQSRRLYLDFAVSPLTRVQLRATVQRWHETIAQLTRARTGRALFALDDEGEETADMRPTADDILKECQRLSSQLGQALLLPQIIDALPKAVRSLTIVPDDTLYGFPFAAIHDGKHYLIERYALAFGFNALAEPGSVRPIEEAVAIGVNSGAGAYPALPGVERELAVLQTWSEQRPGTLRQFKNEHATRQMVIQELAHADFAHIACHGLFDRAKPDQSGLVMIPGSDVEIVSLRDLSQTDLQRMQHMTLSSCWSADHFVLPGRVVVSLPEVLYRAGASSILGSLWEVNDQFAVRFMKEFYENLTKYPRDEALRQAQLTCLHDQQFITAVDSTHPLYWACFVLYGDARPLRFGKSIVERVRHRLVTSSKTGAS